MSDGKKMKEYGDRRRAAFAGRHKATAKREKKLMVNGLAKSG